MSRGEVWNDDPLRTPVRKSSHAEYLPWLVGRASPCSLLYRVTKQRASARRRAFVALGKGGAAPAAPRTQCIHPFRGIRKDDEPQTVARPRARRARGGDEQIRRRV